jgi:hypothetical protein
VWYTEPGENDFGKGQKMAWFITVDGRQNKAIGKI